MSEEWSSDRIAEYRSLALFQQESGLGAGFLPSTVLSLLDALESAREEARIDREQCDHMTSEAAAMAEELAAHRWFAVTPETMPESGQDVIVWAVWDGEGQVRHAVFVKHARGDGGRFVPHVFAHVGGDGILPVTHWMKTPAGPLPSPPVLP